MSEPDIDVVFTWVDGQDPQHQAKLARFLGARRDAPPPAAAPTRFQQVGELEHSVASVLRFAPFVRTIYIVTDAQVPPFLRDPPTPTSAAWRSRVRVVDHRTIFEGYEDLLPTFNSRSIETMLWRIPGLAEHFVYFNDDFSLIKPVTPAAWFVDGRPVLHGDYRLQFDKEPGRIVRRAVRHLIGRPKPARITNALSHSRAAALAGFPLRFLRVEHVPHPLRRSTFERWCARHPDFLRWHAAPRLRSADQVSPLALAHHLEMRAGTAQVTHGEHRLLYLEPATLGVEALRASLLAADRDAKRVFACVQSLDLASAEQQSVVFGWWHGLVGPLPA